MKKPATTVKPNTKDMIGIPPGTVTDPVTQILPSDLRVGKSVKGKIGKEKR